MRGRAPAHQAVPAALALSLLAAAAAALALLSCSPIMIEDENPVDRRVYVNDLAANDSLNLELVRDGVRFVLQPGKPYVFSVATARTTDVLDVQIQQAGGRKAFKKVPAVHDGTRETFALTSPLSTASFFTARLLAGANPVTPGSLSRVALEGQGSALADTLRVKLLFIQTLGGLPTAASKASFATSFFSQMNNILRPHGIVVAGITEIVDPDLKAMDFPFTNDYVSLRGTRTPNHAHIYLVDQITVIDPKTGPAGTVLGFAAREVVDISEHPESRVILANKAQVNRLAITAVHELGHFFGLRHTVSTKHDILQDSDRSNVEDGLADTKMCRLDVSKLDKRSAIEAAEDLALEWTAHGGERAGPYCLRVADNSCSEITCDLDNLMHPVECDPNQIRLSAQQVSLLKRNMALYRR